MHDKVPRVYGGLFTALASRVFNDDFAAGAWKKKRLK